MNRKLVLNLSMLLILFLVSFFRGDGVNPSVIGVKKCTGAYFGVLASLIIVGIIEFIIGVWWVRSDFTTKKRLGYKFEMGDIEM